VDLAVVQIEKQFGKGRSCAWARRVHSAIDSIPTGSISIDYALGVGGVPRAGHRIFGGVVGKTTLALQVIAEAQKTGGLAAFVDAEHALDAAYAQSLASISTTCWCRSRQRRQALEIVEVLVRLAAWTWWS